MRLEKCTSFLLNSIKAFDMYEQPVRLNLRGKNGSTTLIRGLVSLFIILSLVYLGMIKTILMIVRDSPQVIQINEFQKDPSIVLMNRANNFNFGIATRINNQLANMSEVSHLSFTASYNIRTTSEDGRFDFYTSIVRWAPCNKSDFPVEIISIETFNKYGLTFAFCPTGLNFTDSVTGSCPKQIKKDFPECFTPPEFSIEGTLLSYNYAWVELNVKLCDPRDSNVIYGLKCSPDPRKEILESSGMELYLAFTNNFLDPSDYDKPSKSYLDFIQWNIHPQLSTTAYLDVDKETIQDYDSYFDPSTYKNYSFYQISKNTIREQQVYPNDILHKLTLQRSNLNHITTRTYTKVLDVISSIGGLIELFVFMGSIIAFAYARYEYYMLISNELYDFEVPDKKGYSKKKQPQNTQDDNGYENIKQKNIEPSSEPSKLEKLQAKEQTIKKVANNYVKKKRGKLEFSEFKYLKRFILRPFNQTKAEEHKLFQKAKERVNQDLDIVNIVEKLKEIDKLKVLIMNQNQIEAFNFVRKPLIKILEDKPSYKEPPKKILQVFENPELSHSNLNLIELKDGLEMELKCDRFYLAYKKIKEDKNPQNIVMNEKILGMIGEDIIKVFDLFENHQKKPQESNKIVRNCQVVQDELINLTIGEN